MSPLRAWLKSGLISKQSSKRWQLHRQRAIAVATRELRYWKSRRATAHVIAGPAGGSEIRFGSTVTIAREGARVQTFRIVGEDEADPKRGTISHSSPLARTLFGKTEGDAIQLGEREIAILAVK